MILSLNGSTLSGLRVLVLEDEFLIAMDVEHLCRDHGAEAVTILRSVAEAETLQAGAFDVAILDVRVGGRSSLDLAGRLHARRVPFIFASGYGKADGLFDGFAEVPMVSKPYGASALMGALADVLTKHRAT